MNKKLLAVAVASALAVPVTASAQVTISGIFKVGIESMSIGNPVGAQAIANQGTATATPGFSARSNEGQIRMVDNSSRILFNLTEDLGGGLAAIAQLDVRFAPDQASGVQLTNPFANGNTWVGLRSASWGSLTMGRHDLHYGKQPDDIASKAGALEAASVSLMDYMQAANASSAAGNNIAIANASRTQNVVKWDSPNWGGFQVTAAYSTNPLGGSELDVLRVPTTENVSNSAITNCVSIGAQAIPGSGTVTTNTDGGCTAPAATRKGSGYNLLGQYTASNWQVGATMWNAKGDAPSAAAGAADQEAMAFWGYIRFGGFKVGAAVNQSTLKNVSTGADRADRQAYTIPVSYVTGAHNFYAHYTVADKDKILTGADTGAKMYALAYVYDLSKRTSVGITYAAIDNGAQASYNFFTSSSLGSNDAFLFGGEDPTMVQVTMRHAF